MFNLFRVIACAAVLGQHSFIWTNMTGNFVGTGFITMLHLSRTSVGCSGAPFGQKSGRRTSGVTLWRDGT